MKQPQPADPLRAHCLELCQEMAAKVTATRDYALTPGNAWLAKAELQQLAQIISELESLLEQIKQADTGSEA